MMLAHERMLQWFNAVQDLNPAFLDAEDGKLAVTLLKQLGRRVPDRVAKLAYPDGVPQVEHTGWRLHPNGSISRVYEVTLGDSRPDCGASTPKAATGQTNEGGAE
jgi:hypothetical protein